MFTRTAPVDEWRDAAGSAFRTAVATFDSATPPLILGHFDADGLSAVAILARALERYGLPADVRLVGKGENAWDADLRAELAARPRRADRHRPRRA